MNINENLGKKGAVAGAAMLAAVAATDCQESYVDDPVVDPDAQSTTAPADRYCFPEDQAVITINTPEGGVTVYRVVDGVRADLASAGSDTGYIFPSCRDRAYDVHLENRADSSIRGKHRDPNGGPIDKTNSDFDLGLTEGEVDHGVRSFHDLDGPDQPVTVRVTVPKTPGGPTQS